jgi:hypothetical protein
MEVSAILLVSSPLFLQPAAIIAGNLASVAPLSLCSQGFSIVARRYYSALAALSFQRASGGNPDALPTTNLDARLKPSGMTADLKMGRHSRALLAGIQKR